ncbi:5365_t:CDS:1, partial [Racocetra persica]
DMSKVKEDSITGTAVINLIPKPPTPPPKKDIDSELSDSDNQHVTFVSAVRTVGEPTESQFTVTEQVAELSNTLEMDNGPQDVDTEKLAPVSSTTRSQRKELKHVHFSDVESEIP